MTIRERKFKAMGEFKELCLQYFRTHNNDLQIEKHRLELNSKYGVRWEIVNAIYNICKEAANQAAFLLY